MMKEFWLYGLVATALASPPAHLKGRIEPQDGGGHYTTEILPVVVGGQQYALLGFCTITGSRPGEERWLSAPFATLAIAYPDKHPTWRDTRAMSFGLPVTHHKGDPTEYVGVVNRAGLTVDEILNARARYPQLISTVLEHQWLVTQHPVTPEEHATAKELQDCVRILYDKPLLPYYQHEGRQFLAWLARAAK